MMSKTPHIFTLIMTGVAMAQRCPLQFDGRVSTTANLASFDSKAGPFNADNVLGAGRYSEN
jgi:hypothetical protein